MADNDIRIDHGDGVYPLEDFTGIREVHRPNMHLKYRATFVDGKSQGVVTCWWDNGVVAQTGYCDVGICKGIWPDYWEDGTKFKETEYQDSDNFVVRWYDSGGNIKRIERYVDGEEATDN